MDTITVTLPTETAVDFLRQYPHSKYIKAALEWMKSGIFVAPPVSFKKGSL